MRRNRFLWSDHAKAGLSLVEVAATLARQARVGNIAAASASFAISQVRHDFAHQFRVIEITPLLASHALNLIQIHALRGADALHLAGATEFQRRRSADGLPSLKLFSSDSELNQAARLEALPVEDPNDHP